MFKCFSFFLFFFFVSMYNSLTSLYWKQKLFYQQFFLFFLSSIVRELNFIYRQLKSFSMSRCKLSCDIQIYSNLKLKWLNLSQLKLTKYDQLLLGQQKQKLEEIFFYIKIAYAAMILTKNCQNNYWLYDTQNRDYISQLISFKYTLQTMILFRSDGQTNTLTQASLICNKNSRKMNPFTEWRDNFTIAPFLFKYFKISI